MTLLRSLLLLATVCFAAKGMPHPKFNDIEDVFPQSAMLLKEASAQLEPEVQKALVNFQKDVSESAQPIKEAVVQLAQVGKMFPVAAVQKQVAKIGEKITPQMMDFALKMLPEVSKVQATMEKSYQGLIDAARPQLARIYQRIEPQLKDLQKQVAPFVQEAMPQIKNIIEQVARISPKIQMAGQKEMASFIKKIAPYAAALANSIAKDMSK